MTTIDPHVAVTGASASVERHDRRRGDARAARSPASASGSRPPTTSGSVACSSGVVAARRCSASPPLAALLGFERVDAADTMLDVDAIAAAVLALPDRAHASVSSVPLMLGLAIAVVPLQLGARSLAFPRLAAAGFWTWLVGAGAGDRLDRRQRRSRAAATPTWSTCSSARTCSSSLGLVAAAVSVAATVLTTRAPGMNMRRVPLFAWSALIGSLGLVLMLPVLARHARAARRRPPLRPHRRSAPTTASAAWIGFAFTQPATFVYVVPAFGLLAETVATATPAPAPDARRRASPASAWSGSR